MTVFYLLLLSCRSPAATIATILYLYNNEKNYYVDK